MIYLTPKHDLFAPLNITGVSRNEFNVCLIKKSSNEYSLLSASMISSNYNISFNELVDVYRAFKTKDTETLSFLSLKYCK